jgi:hypothetical protein
MPEATPTFVGAIQHLIKLELDQVNVGMPARVLTYDKTKSTVSVQPIVSRGYEGPGGDRKVEALPAIMDVPFVQVGAGGVSLRLAPVKGDIVWLQFASCSIDKWVSTGTEGDPEDDRRFTLSDAVAWPGPQPWSDIIPALQDYAALGGNAATDVEVQLRKTTVDVATVGTGLGATDEMVHGTGIDPFTGQTYKGLGNTSSKLRAEK